MKASWGAKRHCPKCSNRYYDLGKNPVACPKCKFMHDINTPTRPRRGGKAKAPALTLVAKPAVVEKPKDKRPIKTIEGVDLGEFEDVETTADKENDIEEIEEIDDVESLEELEDIEEDDDEMDDDVALEEDDVGAATLIDDVEEAEAEALEDDEEDEEEEAPKKSKKKPAAKLVAKKLKAKPKPKPVKKPVKKPAKKKKR